MTRKLKIVVEKSQEGQRLDQILASVLPGLAGREMSKALVRKLVVAGAVYLNGRRVRIASKSMIPGARIEVWLDEQKLDAMGSGKQQRFEFASSWILFEDEFLIAVAKPAGLPTQPTLDEARDNLFALLGKFLRDRDGTEAYLGLHHRLDRDTSGVILFTKKKEANAGVGEIFAGRLAKKTYQALTVKPFGWRKDAGSEWRVENYLKKEKVGRGKQSWMVPTRSGGDFAATRFRILEVLGKGLLVEANPETGRMHQIRVHLAEEALPILGDDLYGRGMRQPPGVEASRVMLHAVHLTFPHPVHKTEISIHCPPPEDFLKCLASLRARD